MIPCTDRERRALSANNARLLQPSGDSVRATEADVNAEAGTLTGWFVIAARDFAEATAIARTHPHLGHGGWIAVRAIDPT